MFYEQGGTQMINRGVQGQTVSEYVLYVYLYVDVSVSIYMTIFRVSSHPAGSRT